MKLLSYNDCFMVLVLAFVPYIGDEIVFHSRLSKHRLFRYALDSFVHGLIGLISAYSFSKIAVSTIANKQIWWSSVVFCTVVSILIDIDHLFVVKSFKWEDLQNFERRGIFHNTLLMLMISTVLITSSSIFKLTDYIILSWCFLIAVATHHIRDANRRGFLICPVYSTRPLNTYLYIFCICVVPLSCSFVFRFCKHKFVDDEFNYSVV